ncbi:GNAT family N-acetyltransferase [Rossellomorea marisflavi]|uniref:GNAT family N-acetyltransferase n=1 Tax=Rossellomorea marisflavi TaxID=189381 RepID=UPI00207AC158|nr:GNAT family N-acetyltransferase [Rossellomorea marisflavi]USK92963.1 GNAT family N-acetyltransferase [Rossellomorea marisflavi]
MVKLKQDENIILAPVPQEELLQIKEEIQEAFMKGLQENSKEADNLTKPIPSEADFEHSLYSKSAVTRQFLLNGERIGGVVLQIDGDTLRIEVDFLYTLASTHGKGLGTKAWKAVETAFPETKVWELHTPYFEKRNIHFYVNKCGFQIVEFYHRGNPGPHVEHEKLETDEEYEFFRFEKVMK